MDVTALEANGRLSFLCPECKYQYSWSTALPSAQQQTFSMSCDSCGTAFEVRNPSALTSPSSPVVPQDVPPSQSTTPPPVPVPAASFDVRKFGAVILVVGLLIAAYGLIVVAANMPVKTTAANASENWVVAMDRMAGEAMENSTRAVRRQSAMKFLWIGALIATLGGAAVYASNKVTQ